MAELIPAPFADLVTRLFLEPSTQDALFELPRRKWYLPPATGPNLGVDFHGHRAGNSAGPAAGPHTQMAQNLLLSYVAGARILELKTVQIDDRLTIPRPCIDMTNVGYNVEWSQELLVDDSLREYVAGAMLIEMFRHSRDHTTGLLDGPGGDVIYDLSVGYDLAGIKSDKVCRFLDGMRAAGPWVERFRNQIPAQFAAARDLDYPTHLSDSITLSTFHGCPVDEIESICEFLIGDRDFHVVVKMNPPTLGQDHLEHLLHEVMGYTQLRVNPKAYAAAISFDESVALCDRLTRFGAARGRRVGFKFSNTLEVLNHRDFFPPDNEIMYLSGQPLHVIALTLTDAFRQAVGPDVPISFSAGIDRANFPSAVACGMVPVTVSTDLLRPGGYGRLGGYLDHLSRQMKQANADTLDQFLLNRFGQADESRRRAVDSLGDNADPTDLHRLAVRWAGLLNTTIAAEQARQDPRYGADANGKIPKRIESHLEVFDCITCDKCLPVCPNAANFKYPTPAIAFDYHDLLISPDGSHKPGATRRFAIDQILQIACYADFCNECGNCDTFCPEYGGPYIKKPSFFGNLESWELAAPRDGFVVGTDPSRWIRGRIKQQIFKLTLDPLASQNRLHDGTVEVVFAADDHAVVHIEPIKPLTADHRLDMWAYHTLRHLLNGVLDASRVNQVNAATVAGRD